MIDRHGHKSTPNDGGPIRIEDVQGFIPTGAAAPTYAPKALQNQLFIYINGATKRLYVYDHINNAWNYTALT